MNEIDKYEGSEDNTMESVSVNTQDSLNTNNTSLTTYIIIGVVLIIFIVGTIALMKLNKKENNKIS